jgi:hypothetical protein
MNKLCDGGDSVVHRYDGDTGHSPLYNGRVLAELPDMDRQRKRRWRRRCEKVLLVIDAGRPPGPTPQGTGTGRSRLSPRWNGLTQTQAAEVITHVEAPAWCSARPGDRLYGAQLRGSRQSAQGTVAEVLAQPYGQVGDLPARRKDLPMAKIATLVVTVALLGLTAGCKTVSVDQRAALRNEILKSSEETKAFFVKENPGLDQELAAAAGYFTARISGGKVVVGGANGIGVLVDNASNSRTFMNATRVDVGVALGAGTERILAILETRGAFEKFRRGMRKFGFGAKAGVGGAGAKAHSFSEDGYKFLGSSETGAGVTATAGMLSFSVNIDLTDSGVSDVSVPSTGFKVANKQGEDAPRVWNYKLPFLAQKVIDKGYDLPLPYGAGLIYAINEQEQSITGLEVGINGRDKAPFGFVTFDKTLTTTDSVNAKVDAWLFPFMNVYATYGPFKGDADLDILIDGDGMLEHMGISCSGIIRPNLCDSLQGQDILLPIHTTPSGTNWSLGGVFAGGWKGWFVTIPFNFARVDLGPTLADGAPIVTVTPRFGRNFVLGDLGNFALFAGGNYLESKLEISGTYRVPIGGEEITFDYTVQQKNKDAWNLIFGFNWDLNKQFSWNMEYGGFIGTRDAFIASVTWRF